MKKTLFILILITNSLLSQTINYSFTEEIPLLSYYPDIERIDSQEYAQINHERKKETMIFQVFDEKFTEFKGQVITRLPAGSKDFYMSRFKNIKNNSFYVYGTEDKKSGVDYLYAIPFEKNSLKLTAKPIKLIETEKLLSDLYSPKYSFFDTDTNLLLITYRLKPKDKKNKFYKSTMGFSLFNENMSKLYNAEIEMPYAERDMEVLNTLIDSRENIYLLTKVRINNNVDNADPTIEDRKNNKYYRFELMRVNKEKKTMQSIKLSLDKNFVNSVKLKEDLNHHIIITGYYSNINRFFTEGVYLIKLDLDASENVTNTKTTYYEFPKNQIKNYENDRPEKNSDERAINAHPDSYILELENIVFNKDGSILVVGEEYTVAEVKQHNRLDVVNTTYYHNDILALKIDKEGNRQWFNKIQKNQIGDFSEGSFYLHQYDGDSYFFYRDNIKNINLSLSQTPAAYFDPKKSFLTMVKIDSSGNMTKKAIIENSEDAGLLTPRLFERLNDHLIINKILIKKESRIFKLEIN